MNPAVRTSNFRRDAVNTAVGIVWQVPLWTLPVYLVLRDLKGVLISLAVFIVTSLFLKFNWLDKLRQEEDEDEAATP